MTTRDQLPLGTALSLLARDRMDPDAVPDSAQHILNLWRNALNPAAEAALDELAATRGDQSRYIKAARKLLAAVELAEGESEPADNDDSKESEDSNEETSQQDNSQDGEGQSETQENPMLATAPEMARRHTGRV